MLQALNMLENLELKRMGYNSSRYIHALYQVMNLAFADRDFYYGDPYYPPEEPLKGLLSKDYAKHRIRQLNWEKNDRRAGPGDPYPFQNETNPYIEMIKTRGEEEELQENSQTASTVEKYESDFRAGTTSIQAADKKGWVLSITPSGGWIPACIAGKTGIESTGKVREWGLEL